MPVYLFWGDDDFAIAQAVEQLHKSVLDSHWVQFNYDKIPGEQADATIVALNQAMTPVFGVGGRLVWVNESTLCQHCSDSLLAELQRTLGVIPESSHLLLTSSKKPDGRLKSTKFLQKYADIREFSLIPPWKTEEILQNVQKLAQSLGVKLTPQAEQLLAESVGNHTRQLANELEKLSLYQSDQSQALDVDTVAALVNANTQSSLKLATAMLQGNQSLALGLVSDLINRNEPALKIVATLVGQFRTWTIIKLMLEAGEKDEKAMASAAEIANPKRIYFLRQEVQSLSSQHFLLALPLLNELEFNLKRGMEPLANLQIKMIEICHIFRKKTK
jgi:DNA polymerase-3 subunit delta